MFPPSAPTQLQMPPAPQRQPMMPNFFNRVNSAMTANPMALSMAGLGILSGRGNSDAFSRGMQGFMAGRAFDQSDKEAKEKRRHRNVTASYLVKQGLAPDQEAAEALVASGDWKALVGSGTKPTDDMREYEFARSQGYQGSFTDYQGDMRRAGATNVTVGNAKYGTIPSGYQLMEDEAGTRMEPIPGGPAAIEAQQRQEALAAKERGKQAYGNIVTQDIDRAASIIKDAKFPVTGIFGSTSAWVPGTPAHDVAKLIETVKANAGFDRLQAMRDASPTGGALGQVTERELSFLQSAIGNLEQSQSKAQLLFNLDRVRAIYDEIVNGSGGTRPGQQQNRPQGVVVDGYTVRPRGQ